MRLFGPRVPSAGFPFAPFGAIHSLRSCRCSKSSTYTSRPVLSMPALLHGVNPEQHCYVECSTAGSATSKTSAPCSPSAGSLAASQIIFFAPDPWLYLKFFTHLPWPCFAISPFPPRPLLHERRLVGGWVGKGAPSTVQSGWRQNSWQLEHVLALYRHRVKNLVLLSSCYFCTKWCR